MLVDLVEVTTSDDIPLGEAYMAATVAERNTPIDCLPTRVSDRPGRDSD